ncbi:receptor-type tyrosine-protein phosphatase zeta [Grus japonensis]|uniref:Receptor-type tyrosine-protein phosphatase zeta n=1 Tax=Grus japonensis TaxID=30415 RepID=A0ABC9XBM1_GRUJA
MRKRLRYLIPSLRQSSIARPAAPQGIQPPELEDRDRGQNKPPMIQEEAVHDLLCHLDTHKSMGPDGIHPRVLRELAEELAKPFSIIYQQSWLTGEVPDDWRLANVMPIYKKGQKEDPGNYRPDLSTGEGYGAGHLECHHTACTGQPGPASMGS